MTNEATAGYDLTFHNHASIWILLDEKTDAGQEWADEHIADPPDWAVTSIGISGDWRPMRDICEAAREAGLAVLVV